MASPEVKFTVSSKQIVAYVARTGNYSTIGETMRELKGWIDSKGVEQNGYPFCLFYDNPLETQESELRSEVCIPVGHPFEPDGKFMMKEIAAGEVAETRHDGKPEDFYRTYGPFLEGLINSGYQLLGPAREYFMTVSDVKGPGSGFLIQQPIKKK